MRFAYNDKNERIEVSYSGERAVCKDCNSTLIGRKGKIRPKHWYHKNSDCDSWYEPITDWHLNWQNEFPIKNQEITLFDNERNVFHRADIQLNNGMVIEIQNSPIKFSEIIERESFYNNNGLIWILNGATLATKSNISYIKNRPRIELEIEIPNMFSGFDFWDLDNLREKIFEMKSFKLLKTNEYLKEFKFWQNFRLIFEFKVEMNFEDIEYHFRNELKLICEELYLNNKKVQKETIFNITNEPNIKYKHICLNKNYWRSFIDEMKSPVFIDNLEGLNEDHLLWYQENKIIEKKQFLKKYLQMV